MSRETLDTLFHPFNSGALEAAGTGQRALFLGAEPDFRLPEGFAARLSLVQGFRPHFRALQRSNLEVAPQAEGDNYDAALVLCGRHRGENELRIAEAIARTRQGGLIVVAGGKDEGIASLRKRMADQVAIDGHLPKYHGTAFWFRHPADGDTAAETLRNGAKTDLVEGRFRTAPGMFSHDRIDAGSKLLANNLPDQLSGRVADFCAGWGYLASEVALRFSKVKALDLYEADFASLEAAKANLADVKSPPTRFFWHDLAGEPVTERYDAIVMNPPFHTGRRAEPELGQTIIKTAIKALKPGGRLYLVANRQLPYEKTLAGTVSEFAEIAGDRTFKVLVARR
ncbi:class I SAM-dependent methyltransferase [Mesorhizobium sp. IMUNJ 23232]|uniref:class I SAM-dependent methyltransferase n=1 Tax=Mesorhizobium sp. IMUNJ 23232 TaxID=3376064 RepID=UPI00378E5E13